MTSWNGVEDYPAQTLSDYGWLDATSHRVLDTVVAMFGQAGVSLPERQYVAAGPANSVVHDCEQLTVTTEQIYFGTPGEPAFQPGQCELSMSGDFVVELVRCIPTGQPSGRNPNNVKPPSTKSLIEATKVQAIDAQILLEASYAVNSMQGVVAQVTFGTPQGGFQSVILSMSCSLSEK